MEPEFAAELNDANLSALFEGCEDFVRRELWIDGQTVFFYAIDGLVASAYAADFVLRPLADGMLSGPPEERWRQALSGRLYNAVAKPVEDLSAAAEKLLGGFCLLLFPGGGAAAFEVKTPVNRTPVAAGGGEHRQGGQGRPGRKHPHQHFPAAPPPPHARPAPYLRHRRRRSRTTVTVCSIKGLTDPELVEKVLRRLRETDIDGLLSPPL